MFMPVHIHTYTYTFVCVYTRMYMCLYIILVDYHLLLIIQSISSNIFHLFSHSLTYSFTQSHSLYFFFYRHSKTIWKYTGPMTPAVSSHLIQGRSLTHLFLRINKTDQLIHLSAALKGAQSSLQWLGEYII